MTQIVTELTPTDGYGPLYWVGHPDGSKGEAEDRIRRAREPNPDKRLSPVQLIIGLVDDTLSYEFDEAALIKMGSNYFLCQTSGCSCPAPSENWGVVHGPLSAKEMLDKVLEGAYEGQTWHSFYEAAVCKALIDEVYNA